MIDTKGTEDSTPDEGNKPTHNDSNNGTTTSGNTDAPTSSVPVVSTVSSSVTVITKPVTSTTSGNTPSAILRMNYATLVDAITNSLQKVTDALYAKELIPPQTNQSMLVPAVDNYTKAANLMNVIEK
ncbi:PREDICTED: uncharacterized protein LOC109590133, partial [Amphimedon queenslandica]|uniref:Uncharacterized protein n=1 Tax=Amphimedon queenslandica TaxID=400682 RepID=A0AAN0JXF3_AMPQE